MTRPEITEEQIALVVAAFEQELRRQLGRKGPRAFVSTHEVAGVVTEEYHEMLAALHGNDLGHFRSELLDIAVGCVFGVACLDAGHLEAWTRSDWS